MVVRAVPTILAMLASCAALCACSGGTGGSAGIARVGQPAPSWSEPTAPSGAPLALASLRGKAVYLNFFATWCPPCNEEAASINALQKRFGAQGLQVVGVDELESAAKAEQFRSEHRLVYPTVVDNRALGHQYSVNGLPVHVFIDRRGIVRTIVVGELSAAQMQANVERILR